MVVSMMMITTPPDQRSRLKWKVQPFQVFWRHLRQRFTILSQVPQFQAITRTHNQYVVFQAGAFTVLGRNDHAALGVEFQFAGVAKENALDMTSLGGVQVLLIDLPGFGFPGFHWVDIQAGFDPWRDNDPRLEARAIARRKRQASFCIQGMCIFAGKTNEDCHVSPIVLINVSTACIASSVPHFSPLFPTACIILFLLRLWK